MTDILFFTATGFFAVAVTAGFNIGFWPMMGIALATNIIYQLALNYLDWR